MNKIIIGVLVVLTLVFGVLYFTSQPPVGGDAHWSKQSFIEGFYSGTGRQLSVDNSGLLTTSGGVTNSGALTQSGAATFSGNTTVNESASTTLTVGSSATGCIILGHSVSGDPVYITTVSSTISATTTKPSVCR